MLRPTLALAALTLLGACAGHTWAPGPGMSASDFAPAKARCDYIARHGGTGFVAVGSQQYVNNAALGYAVGEAVRTQRDFDDCMLMSGWRIADGAGAASSQSDKPGVIPVYTWDPSKEPVGTTPGTAPQTAPAAPPVVAADTPRLVLTPSPHWE
jgi:hypothetical protein